MGRTAWLQCRFHNGKQCKEKCGKVVGPDPGKIAKSERGLPLGSIEPVKGKLTCVEWPLCTELCVNFFIYITSVKLDTSPKKYFYHHFTNNGSFALNEKQKNGTVKTVCKEDRSADWALWNRVERPWGHGAQFGGSSFFFMFLSSFSLLL